MSAIYNRKRIKFYDILLVLFIFAIWAFNETKIITYPIKILYIIAMAYYFISRKKDFSYYQLWCALMVLLSFVAMLISNNLSSSAIVFVNMLQVFLIGFVTYAYVDTTEKIEFIIKVFVWAGILLTVRLLLLTPMSELLTWRRVGLAIGSNPNDVGNKGAISAIFALYVVKNKSEKHRMLYLITGGILAALVLFSGSRKALIALVIAAVLLFTIGLQNKRKFLLSLLCIAIAVVLLWNIVMSADALYETIGRRIESMIDALFGGASEKQSIDLREKYLSIAFNLIRENPIFGIGLGQFQNLSGVGVYSHCDYTEVACSYGIIGMAIYYIPLLICLTKYVFLKNKTDIGYTFMIMQLVLLFIYITMVMYTSAYLQIILVLFFAYYRLQKQEKLTIL